MIHKLVTTSRKLVLLRGAQTAQEGATYCTYTALRSSGGLVPCGDIHFRRISQRERERKKPPGRRSKRWFKLISFSPTTPLPGVYLALDVLACLRQFAIQNSRGLFEAKTSLIILLTVQWAALRGGSLNVVQY